MPDNEIISWWNKGKNNRHDSICYEDLLKAYQDAVHAEEKPPFEYVSYEEYLKRIDARR